MKKYKVLIDSAMWGCLANIINCSRQLNYLEKNGHTITYNPKEADFFIVNSCGTAENNEQTSIAIFQAYYDIKKPGAKVIMTGCLPKIAEDKLKGLDLISIPLYEGEKFDEIFFNKVKYDDIRPVCDDKTRNKLMHGTKKFWLDEFFSTIIPRILHSFSKKYRSKYKNIANEKRAIVEINYGCTGNCSYCVIKKAKGKIQSFNMEDILGDIEKIQDSCKEVFLASEDCGSYGAEIKSGLPELLREINERYPHLEFYLDYLDPYWLQRYPEEYLELFKNVKIKMARIAMQSGSKRILKKMRRRYDIEKVSKVLKQIKKVSPNTLIYNTYIVGFPGENIVDYLRSLYDLLRSSTDYSYVNDYSDREGSESYSFPDKKSKFTIKLRFNIFLIFSYLFSTIKFIKNRDLLLAHISFHYWIYK